jgi:DNA-binding response OmpR family regulator
MTTLGDRSARLGNSPARTSTVFIVAKDPETHFGDTRPAFSKHGAVVLEVDDPQLMEHLLGMLAEEDPELASSIVTVSSRDLTPACLLRARKDVERTAGVVYAVECGELHDRNNSFAAISRIAFQLNRHIEDLKTVLPDILRNAELKASEIQRCSQTVLECWRLIGAINSASSGHGLQIPHPLAKEAERIRMQLEQSLPMLAHVKHFESGSAALDAVIDSIVTPEPDSGPFIDDYELSLYQKTERLMTRLAAEYGEGTEHIDRGVRDRLNQIEQRIARHAKRVEAAKERDDAARREAAQQRLAESVKAPPPKAPVPQAPASHAEARSTAKVHADEEMPIEEADWAKRFDVGAGLVIDPAQCSVSLNGKSYSFGKRSGARFKLLFILAKHRNRWVPAKRLSQPDGPWREKDGVTPSTLNSAVSRLRASLKELPALAKALECQSNELHGHARLQWPPESSGD